MELRKTQRERAELEKTLEKRLYDVRSDLYHAGERIKFIERSRIWKLRNQLAGLRKLFKRGQGEPSAARRP
jgi:hypothetical protein